jgi:hypothetical protein
MTTADKTARRVYSAEQLHRLRASFSAPKLREAIEEHDGEDAELVKGVSSSRYITRLLLLLHLPSRLRGQPQVASPINKTSNALGAAARFHSYYPQPTCNISFPITTSTSSCDHHPTSHHGDAPT